MLRIGFEINEDEISKTFKFAIKTKKEWSAVVIVVIIFVIITLKEKNIRTSDEQLPNTYSKKKAHTCLNNGKYYWTFGEQIIAQWIF